MIDLRGEKPQYIFVRKFVPGANSCTFKRIIITDIFLELLPMV